MNLVGVFKNTFVENNVHGPEKEGRPEKYVTIVSNHVKREKSHQLVREFIKVLEKSVLSDTEDLANEIKYDSKVNNKVTTKAMPAATDGKKNIIEYEASQQATSQLVDRDVGDSNDLSERPHQP